MFEEILQKHTLPVPKTVAVIFLADKVCEHFLGLLGELVSSLHRLIFGLTSLIF